MKKKRVGLRVYVLAARMLYSVIPESENLLYSHHSLKAIEKLRLHDVGLPRESLRYVIRDDAIGGGEKGQYSR